MQKQSTQNNQRRASHSEASSPETVQSSSFISTSTSPSTTLTTSTDFMPESTVSSLFSNRDDVWHHEIIHEPLEEDLSSEDSSVELSTEDDDSEEDRAYREAADQRNIEEEDESVGNEPFKRLNDTLKKDRDVHLNISVNKAELLLAGLRFADEYDLSQTALADLFLLLNSALQTRLLPDTRYLVDQIFNSDDTTEYHAVCPNENCNSYVGKFTKADREMLCSVCGELINLKSPCYYSFFTIFNVENECSNLIQNNLDHIKAVIQKRRLAHDTMTDFTDGNLYKEFLRSLSPEERNNFLSSTCNSDGVPAFEDSKFSIWPIQMKINELPFEISNAKPIVCGLWFSKRKPDMNIFLLHWVEMMNRLSNDGVPYEDGNQIHRMKIHTLCCCVDASARAPMQGTVQYNGYFGCAWCLHPGVYVPTLRGGSVKYILLEELPPRRTQLETYQHMQLSLEHDFPVFGIKRPSVFINLEHFNIISGFVPDPMHCSDLGVAAQFLDLWFDTTGMPYSLSNEDIEAANRTLLQIKAPNQAMRLTRSITERSWWKAREFENWILFFSIVVMSQFPHMQVYVQHWSLYVESFYINHKAGVTIQELDHAHDLALQFEAGTEFLYGQHSMTNNVHQSEHMTQSSMDWGPAYNHSGYCFESGNGRIVRKIHAAKGVLLQLCRSICMTQSEVIIRRHLQSRPLSELQTFVSHLDNKYAKFSSKGATSRYFGPYTRTKEKWVRELQLSKFSRTYTKMVKDSCLYTSSRRNRIRSNNSYAITVDGMYVKLRDFIYDNDTLKEYILCKNITVENPHESFPVKQIVNVSENVSAISTEKIAKICVYMENKNHEFVCAVPNMFHC